MDNNKKIHIAECKKRFEQWRQNHRFIIRYVRHAANKHPFAVVLAYADNGQIRVGFSKCNKTDVWNRYIGLLKAIDDGRSDNARVIPMRIMKEVHEMIDFAHSDKGRECLEVA